jgi:hypothetical protein
MGLRIGRGPNKRRVYTMSMIFNRLLDISASYLILALGLTIAGATAVVGA